MSFLKLSYIKKNPYLFEGLQMSWNFTQIMKKQEKISLRW